MKQKQTQTVEQKYNSARVNLLLMIILTLVNVVLFFTGSESMLLFSATVPYYSVAIGNLLMPPDVAVYTYVFAGIVVAVYFLCWLLSKKNYVWMIVALVMFIIDTVALAALYIWLGDVSGILDAVIHAMMLYYLIVGVISGAKMKKQAAEVPEQAQEWLNADPEKWEN